MMAFGFAEVLVLALLAGGMNNSDLVAVIQPKDYFESRQKRLSVDSMIDICIADPKDSKAQVMQLTALRYLMDESDTFKKASNYASNREAIEEIAGGKRAQDKAGFAKEYAQRLLDKLDGKKPAVVKLEPMRADAFAWFPADVSFAGALDLRTAPQAGDDPIKALLKMMPEREKAQLYMFVEKIGNVRIERMAFAYSDGEAKGDGRIYVRMTGKGSHDGLLELINQIEGNRLQSKELKADDGAKITLLSQANNQPPVIMLVGNTDFLVVGTERFGAKVKQMDFAQAVLDVRAKKKPSAATGPFKDPLAKLPEKAAGFLIGEFPAPFKQKLEAEFGAAPSKGLAYVERTAQGLDLRAEASLANADDANKIVQKIGELRKMGVMVLQKEMQRPLPPGAPAVPFQQMINVLEGMQVQSQGAKLNVRVTAPNSLIQQLPMLFLSARAGFDIEP